MNADQKSLETVLLIAICRQLQSKILFLNIFYLRSLVVLTFSIATCPVYSLPREDYLCSDLTGQQIYDILVRNCVQVPEIDCHKHFRYH